MANAMTKEHYGAEDKGSNAPAIACRIQVRLIPNSNMPTYRPPPD
jgi:hypothetical protein